MKKGLMLLIVMPLILTGCGKKEELQSNSNNNETVNEVENIETKESETVENELTEETVEEEPIVEVEREEEKTEVREETPKKDTVTDSSTSKTEQSKEETTKSQEPTCTVKKFNNKYSYVYTTKEECVSKGNNAFMDIYEKVDDSVFTYGCQEIVDDCGTTWYGVYFNRATETGEIIRVYY